MQGHPAAVYGPATAAAAAQNTSCSIQKLQQLTNGIMDIVPQGPPMNTMTPPPNLTPPPTMTPPPGMQRNLTPPISNLPSQVSMTMNQAQYYKYQRRQAQIQRSPNVTIGPNLMSGYNTYSYRLQQQSQVPFQMVNMNMNVNLPGQLAASQMQGAPPQMNYQVQDVAAGQMQPPHTQPSMNTAAMYTYGYIPTNYMRR
ncbi:PREDICTED: histone acetyltransferase KAT6B-like [Priapulus caudatus]|uniref:Histone acetyltransferase KAT6B-like n=1 Tax=Priapulus caudatus TaxID=37621 RepID=A0ABM1F2I4_PRICU|nr:PREDICTED: histone acetyltransferase KAT6B-like [Priapulus caudatus]